MATLSTPQKRPGKATPWKVSAAGTRRNLLLASTLPAAASAAIAFAFGIEFIVALLLIFLPLQLLGAILAGRVIAGARGQEDAILTVMTVFLSVTVLVLLISVVWSVVEAGSKAISFSFLTQNNVYITPTTQITYGGVGHSILGTLMVVGLTTIVTVPLGIATAIYLTETRDKSRGIIRTLVQALSGLPSIVAGLFVYSMLIVTGFTTYVGWAGSLALVPLMLPTVTRVAEEALLLVPQELRNGALALGAPAWKTFSMVTMPAAKSGLITALLLGVARVIGETAPLLVTTFAANNTNLNPFSGSISTLPTYLYQYTSFGYDTSIQRAWGAALVILMLVGILFASARILGRSKPTTAKSRKQKNV